MASVTLGKFWVHRQSDHEDAIALLSVDGYSPEFEVGADVRTYAGGRRRIVRNDDEADALTFTAKALDRDDVASLRSMTGDEVMVRDPRGRVVWGMFSKLSVGEVRSVTDMAEVTLTVQSTSTSAEV